MTWKPDPTTTTSTVPDSQGCDSQGCPTATTTPTVPTVPVEGCGTSQSDIVCVDTPPTTTAPETTTTVAVGCAPGEFPQGPTGDEPCGPTDLCSADGVTRNWSLLPCDPTPVTETTVAVAEPNVPTLPATGGETGWIALTGTVMILTGISLVSMVKGRRA